MQGPEKGKEREKEKERKKRIGNEATERKEKEDRSEQMTAKTGEPPGKKGPLLLSSKPSSCCSGSLRRTLFFLLQFVHLFIPLLLLHYQSVRMFSIFFCNRIALLCSAGRHLKTTKKRLNRPLSLDMYRHASNRRKKEQRKKRQETRNQRKEKTPDASFLLDASAVGKEKRSRERETGDSDAGGG